MTHSKTKVIITAIPGKDYSLFGLARDNDIKTISKHIDQQENYQVVLFQELQHQNFLSIMQLVDQRMSNVMSAVQFNHHALQSLKQSLKV